ncbi:MAG TPA: response regulator [Chloroflexota bacterium]|nr:response regulator [Chloroflexota bacterium]
MTDQPHPAAAPSVRRVLLVEDDESVGVSLAAVLERHGSQVTLIPSVALALDLLRQRAFDVVISDLMLDDEHGRTGFAVLSEAKRCQPGITTILITGYPSEAVARRAAEERIASLLSKPLDIAELLSALAAQPAAPLTTPPGGV